MVFHTIGKNFYFIFFHFYFVEVCFKILSDEENKTCFETVRNQNYEKQHEIW